MGLTLWVATTRRDGPARQRRSETGGGRLWERRSVEKSFGLSHLAWKSRPHRGIPTFPQSRRRCSLNLKPDISCALKSGHFNLLTTPPKRKIVLLIPWLVPSLEYRLHPLEQRPVN